MKQHFLKNRGDKYIDIEKLSDIQAEAGIIASAIYKPEFIFHSDSTLTPHHFYDKDNGFIYHAICELARKGSTNIDAYNIMMVLNSDKHTEGISANLNPQNISTIIELGKIIARETVEEYLILVEIVMDKAFRRAIHKELLQCQAACFNETEEDIKNIIFNRIDKTISTFSGIEKIPKFSEIVDDLWLSITERHKNGGMCGLPSKFPKANEYFTYENGELILICGARKDGKSIICMNEVANLLKLNKSVLTIDTEMSDRQYFERLVSHITKIPVKSIKMGGYSAVESERISSAIKWIKSKNLTHIYMPSPNMNKVYSIVKRMKINNAIDILVYDYIKSQNSNSSSEIYNMLGDHTNFLKNRIAGELDLPVLALAQLNRGGDISDSIKIEQFASTVSLIRRKRTDEITRDGYECGNYKFFIKLNRLGEQMSDLETDYIDLQFDGNTVTFEQAQKQHEDSSPY